LGSIDFGFGVPAGTAQVDELPWVNLNQVSLTFSHDVGISASSLHLRSGGARRYSLDPGTFTYESPIKTATWRLAPGETFGADRLCPRTHKAGRYHRNSASDTAVVRHRARCPVQSTSDRWVWANDAKRRGRVSYIPVTEVLEVAIA
jgi:hypothetical protein